MNFKCRDCERYCDIMIDGYTEMAHGGAICDKCWYGEWEAWEIEERKIQKEVERDDVCPKCFNGCDYCLMLEPRSFR